LFGALRDTRGERHVQTLVWATQMESLVSVRKVEGPVLDASRLCGAVRFPLGERGVETTSVRGTNIETRVGERMIETRVLEIMIETCVGERMIETHGGERMIETRVGARLIETRDGKRMIETRVG